MAGVANHSSAGSTTAGVAMPASAVVTVPRLRGMLHALTFPAAAVAGVLLIALAPTRPGRLAAAVYALTGMALFGVSAAYHRSAAGTGRKRLLRRLDHVSILLVIAGTYTPLAVLALRGATRLSVLAVIWAGAAGGAAARLIWRSSWRPAPRWLSTTLFIALGWVAITVLPQLLRAAGVLVLALVLTGGILYSVGAVVYARKRPDPSPRWFGFHELFHAFTIAAFFFQYAAVSLVVYRSAA